MSAKKTCSLRHLQGGPCRRVAADAGLCRRHAHARDVARAAEADMREIATELCCAMGRLFPGRKLLREEAYLMADLYRANERLQSAFVALHSRSGRDEDAG